MVTNNRIAIAGSTMVKIWMMGREGPRVERVERGEVDMMRKGDRWCLLCSTMVLRKEF